MKNGKLLTKTAAVIATATILSGATYALDNKTIPYTSADLVNNPTYVTELQEIEQETNIEFTNKELLASINKSLGYELTPENIKEVTELNIIETFENNDFSDLKYFTNLQSINFYANEVDLSCLKYNQKLETVIIENSLVTNTNLLPNSIEEVALFDSIIGDNLLYLPYNTKYAYISETGLTNIKPKNPAALLSLTIDSNISSVDLQFLEECKNLVLLSIYNCPNISSPEALTKLNKYCGISLDDFAPIWLNYDILSKIKNLDEEDQDMIIRDTIGLDTLADTLIPDKSVSDIEKLRRIANYIFLNLKYDDAIANDLDNNQELAESLNKYPIHYALFDEEHDEVCINYACLFQGLANRVGINSTQLMSEFHTWNLVNGEYIDLTALDNSEFYLENDDQKYSIEEIINMGEEIPDYIYFCVDYEDPAYEETYHFHEQFDVDNNIGYVKSSSDWNTPSKVAFKISKNIVLAIGFITVLNFLNKLYDYLLFHRREEEINEKIESSFSKR